MDESSFLEETVGVVVVLSGFQKNILDSLGVKPVDGGLQHGVAYTSSPALGIHQNIAYHTEGSASVHFDIGNAESEDAPLVVDGFPDTRDGLVIHLFQDIFYPFFTGV